ncbi:hypothetical protein EVAR_59090_1 [Eumeta japonica]|uniref:Uncharacterized protein n=1 Tax=Eumeta variegata TaxID=151549 RepID=A0A4C1Z1E4_EUMVA|nr:hypothetical protein EVAR_59090_1 [Eumeta japonica]
MCQALVRYIFQLSNIPVGSQRLCVVNFYVGLLLTVWTVEILAETYSTLYQAVNTMTAAIISAARGRPIIVEWERDARHSAGLSRSVTHRYVTERYTFSKYLYLYCHCVRRGLEGWTLIITNSCPSAPAPPQELETSVRGGTFHYLNSAHKAHRAVGGARVAAAQRNVKSSSPNTPSFHLVICHEGIKTRVRATRRGARARAGRPRVGPYA